LRFRLDLRFFLGQVASTGLHVGQVLPRPVLRAAAGEFHHSTLRGPGSFSFGL
jgi:hypothetical protein